jgi:hypothetical protein
VQIINNAKVEVFPPQHTTNFLLHSVLHMGNADLVLIVNPFITPWPTYNLRTKRDLTVNVADEVEHMVSGTVLVVVEDGKHISRLDVSLIYCTRKKGDTTGSAGAYVADALD